MASYVIDSELFRDQFSTAESRRIFSDRNTVQKWLEVEAALARAEAELGIVPREAAAEITRVADVELYDLAAMKAEMDRTAHPIVPLVRAMTAQCRDGLGEYVHWGATTQDIMDTGMILQLREAWAEFAGSLSDIKANLRRIAAEHKATPMPGRTHGQQALPITFGYKVAVWVAEAQRNQERMEQAAPRIFQGQFAGAVGTMASLGDRGLEVQPLLMRELGLTQPLICWHSGRDSLYEFANIAALLGGLCGQVAREVYTLSRTEIGELEEPFHHGKVGSSTMPQKRNPAICEGILALTRSIRSSLSMAFDALSAEHERDKVATQTDREYLPRLCCQVDAALKKTVALTAGLTVKPDAMRRNLDITRGLLLSEAVMMRLAEQIGRQEAHDVVYEAAMAAWASGRTLKDHLMEDATVTEKLDENEIDELLSPEAYVGLSERFVDRVLEGTA